MRYVNSLNTRNNVGDGYFRFALLLFSFPGWCDVLVLCYKVSLRIMFDIFSSVVSYL